MIIFTIPLRSMMSLDHQGEKERFAKIQFKKNLRSFFGSTSHTTTKIKAARNNMTWYKVSQSQHSVGCEVAF